MEVKEYYDFVVPLVREAGKEIAAAKNFKIETKGEIYDEVTEYDRKIENILIRKIKERWPHHKFIGEEESHVNGIKELTNHPTWIIDPIDGTSNFVRNLRDTCISVGLIINKKQKMGIVLNPFNDELYTAIEDQGAFLNGKQIHVKQETNIKRAVFNYELSLARNPKYYELYMYRLKYLIQVVNGFRSLGSAVLGLCYVAAGRLDAYQCDGLYPWDAAAGVLIVREAGGYVCDTTTGGEFDLMDPNFLATSTKELSDQFMEIEKKADEERLNDINNKKQFKP